MQRDSLEDISTPMSHAGHDLLFDVFLYIFPFLAIFWRARGKQGS